MELSASITDETEFHEWLAGVLEAERERLRKEAMARESWKHSSFKVETEKHNEGDTAS